MENLTPAEMWTAILGIASAIVLISNAIEKIGKAIRTAKAPNARLEGRMDEFDEWRKGVDQKLDNDKKHLDAIDEGTRATQRALLALLDHGIDGNNIKQMQEAKDILQNHLINR